MNSLHIYGFIFPPSSELILPQGIFQKVQVINSDRLAAIVEPDINLELIKQDDQQLIDAVLVHDRVLCEIFAQTTILPLRFGVAFASVSTLLTELKTQGDDYLQLLYKITNKAEYTIKFTPLPVPETKISPVGGGRNYFLAKKQKYQEQQDFYHQQTQQWQEIVNLISADYPTIIQGEGEIKKIQLLIDKNLENSLINQLEQWENLAKNWQITISSALPPYHFISQ